VAEAIEQPLPRLWPDTAFFWTSGADGQLRFLSCEACGHLVHPPAPICRGCGAEEPTPQVVSGNASVWSFSVVHQPFIQWLDVPYVLAIVAIDDDPSVHLTTRIVDCDPEEVAIGMRVRVQFEQHGEIYLPLFAPRREKDGSRG
jgi:uncharacterized protein